MQFSIVTVLVGLVAVASAGVIEKRQNENRPVPQGECCVANTSLKQDTCTAANGEQGRCVPGGNDCGGRLSCVQQSSLVCEDNIEERGNTLCRAQAPGGGFFDGANIIFDFADATVN